MKTMTMMKSMAVTAKMVAVVTMMSMATVMSAQRYQSTYSVMGNRVMYNKKEVKIADAASFQVLGYGYAKDKNNVYLDGEILRFVDPQGFHLHGQSIQQGATGEVTAGRGHAAGQTGGNVDHPYAGTNGHMYGGNNGYQIGDGHDGPGYHIGNDGDARPADAHYHITKWDVYFEGKKISGASASSFKDLGNGYGKDSFDVYYMGEKIKRASASSFKVLGYGYSKDSFNVYYNGVEIKGASANSFKVDSRGYAHDSFDTYYWGKKI